MKKLNCVHCSQPADTQDHIPSRNLYKRVSSNLKPIKVPSCKNCNNTLFSKDEVYFRDLMTGLMYEKSITATHVFDTNVINSIRKNPSLAMKMFKSMQPINLYSKSGLYLGKKTAVKIDHPRVFNVLDKYIKALFYYHFNQNIPRDWIIKHFWLTPKFEAKIIDSIKELKWETIDENIFAYGYNFVPNTFQSIWCLIFFGRPLFYSMVLDPVTANRDKSIIKKRRSSLKFLRFLSASGGDEPTV